MTVQILVSGSDWEAYNQTRRAVNLDPVDFVTYCEHVIEFKKDFLLTYNSWLKKS